MCRELAYNVYNDEGKTQDTCLDLITNDPPQHLLRLHEIVLAQHLVVLDQFGVFPQKGSAILDVAFCLTRCICTYWNNEYDELSAFCILCFVNIYTLFVISATVDGP